MLARNIGSGMCGLSSCMLIIGRGLEANGCKDGSKCCAKHSGLGYISTTYADQLLANTTSGAECYWKN